MLRPASRWPVTPWRLSARSRLLRPTMKRNSSAFRSVSFSRLRPCRSIRYSLLGGIASDGAGHAPGTTAAAAEFAAGHADHLDAMLAQHGVGGDVAVVAEDHPGSDREVIVPVVPLLTFGGPDVLVSDQHGDLGYAQRLRQCVPQAAVVCDLKPSVRVVVSDGPGSPVAVDVGVEHEGSAVDHGHHRVEVHHRVRLGQLDGDYGTGLGAGEEGAGE